MKKIYSIRDQMKKHSAVDITDITHVLDNTARNISNAIKTRNYQYALRLAQGLVSLLEEEIEKNRMI